jgi:hypothetical protein
LAQKPEGTVVVVVVVVAAGESARKHGKLEAEGGSTVIKGFDGVELG